MKKLVTRFLVLLGCALPLGLATCMGTAGADEVSVTGEVVVTGEVSVTGEVVVTVGDRTMVVPIPPCAFGPGCAVEGQPNICLGGGGGTTFGVTACTALGEH